MSDINTKTTFDVDIDFTSDKGKLFPSILPFPFFPLRESAVKALNALLMKPSCCND
jgi:hypothetical protein